MIRNACRRAIKWSVGPAVLFYLSVVIIGVYAWIVHGPWHASAFTFGLLVTVPVAALMIYGVAFVVLSCLFVSIDIMRRRVSSRPR